MTDIHEEPEEWRKVDGFGEVFSVSSLGRIRNDQTLRVLKSGRIGDYRGISLCSKRVTGNNRKSLTVHSIVARAFIGPRPVGYDINHKNGMKADNRARNLEYTTRSENILHAIRTGLLKSCRGETHGRAVLDTARVQWIRRLRSTGMSWKDIGFLANATANSVRFAGLRITWRHVE